MQINNLFHISYWFYQPFVAREWSLWVFVGGFLLLVVAGLVFKIVVYHKEDKTTRELLRRFGNFCFIMGFLGLLWMFFRQERVAFLAWRFWLLVWILIFVWWLSGIARYAIKRVPEIRKEQEERNRISKYLPK